MNKSSQVLYFNKIVSVVMKQKSERRPGGAPLIYVVEEQLFEEYQLVDCKLIIAAY